MIQIKPRKGKILKILIWFFPYFSTLLQNKFKTTSRFIKFINIYKFLNALIYSKIQYTWRPLLLQICVIETFKDDGGWLLPAVLLSLLYFCWFVRLFCLRKKFKTLMWFFFFLLLNASPYSVSYHYCCCCSCRCRHCCFLTTNCRRSRDKKQSLKKFHDDALV